jgi:prevent-host-death family protein
MREREELSVTAASARGVARLVADAAHGEEVVVTRHRRPVAAVVGVEHLRELDELAADLRDLALVIARTADDTGRRTSLASVRSPFERA